MYHIIAVALILAVAEAAHTPGLGVKLTEPILANLNHMLYPLIMSRYANKDYLGLGIRSSGSNYELKLNELRRLTVNPLSSEMESKMETKGSDNGFRVTLKAVEALAQFQSEITIDGKMYVGAGRIVVDQSQLAFFVSLVQKGENVELLLEDAAFQKPHIDVIYTDPALNSTLKGYKELLKEAYSKALAQFVYYLTAEANANKIHNLVLNYSPACGIDVSPIALSHFDMSDRTAILLLDGGIVDLKTKQKITTEYPAKFPLDELKKHKKGRTLIADKVLEGLLSGCGETPIAYSGRKETVEKTTEEIPEIFRTYSKTDLFGAEVSLQRPLHLRVTSGGSIKATSSIVHFTFTVDRGTAGKEVAFQCALTMDWKMKTQFHKHDVSVKISDSDVTEVKVISTHVELDSVKLKKVFGKIMNVLEKEFNAQPKFLDFSAPGIPMYFANFFTVTDVDTEIDYLGVKYEQPSS